MAKLAVCDRTRSTEKNVRNAIERTTVSATRIEIVLNESVVAEGQDRVLTLPWTRTSSRRRREIIEGVAKRSNAYEPCERKRERVSAKHCATLTAGSTNSYSIPPRPSSRSPREGRWSGRRCRSCSTTSGPARPMLWSEQWAGSDCRRRLRFEPNSADPSRSFPRAANPPCRHRKSLSLCSGLSIAWSGKRNFAG